MITLQHVTKAIYDHIGTNAIDVAGVHINGTRH